MLSHPAMLTLAETGWQPVLSVLSLLVGIGALVVTVLKHLDGKTAKARDDQEAERQKRADDRHGVLVEKLDMAHERVTQTKAAVEAFRADVAVEIASLHQADARLALDLERRVAPIEGKLGIGRARQTTEGGN